MSRTTTPAASKINRHATYDYTCFRGQWGLTEQTYGSEEGAWIPVRSKALRHQGVDVGPQDIGAPNVDFGRITVTLMDGTVYEGDYRAGDTSVTVSDLRPVVRPS